MQPSSQSNKTHKAYLSTDTASELTRCLVFSRLDYCNSILYSIPQQQQDRLQRIMNKGARITLNILLPNHLTSSNKNLASLHWLPIKYRIPFKIATITYKTIFISQPSYFRNLITINKNNKNLCSSSSITLVNQRTSTNIAKRGFRHSSPSVWNSLPHNIRNCTSFLFYIWN